jgi:hypothetical protein
MFGGFAPLPLRLGGNNETGLTVAQHARLCADLVACVKTAPLARIAGKTGSDDVYAYNGQPSLGIVNAPSVAFGVGYATMTWPVGYEDPFGQAYALKIQSAKVTAVAPFGAPTARIVTYTIDAPNVVTVRSFNTAGGGLDLIHFFLVVY